MANNKLEEEGWRLSSEWLSAQSCTGDSLRQKALNTSLKVSGRPCLPAAQQSLSRGDLRGPLVLQIVRSENISAPSARQGSAGGGGGSVPRMLRLTLSDGTTSLSALELQPAAKLPAALPTGAKVRFGHSVLPIENGMLLLDDKVDYLGGKVPGLFDHWEQQQGLARHIRYDSSVAAGRPPFVAFSKDSVAKARQALRERRNEHRTRKREAQREVAEATFERAPVASAAAPLLPDDNNDDVLAARRAKLGIGEPGSERGGHRGGGGGGGRGRGRGHGRGGRRRRHGDEADDDDDDDGPATLTLDEYNALMAAGTAQPSKPAGTSAAAAAAPDAAQVRMLTDMGFAQTAAMAALRQSGNRVEAAIDLLVSGQVVEEQPPRPERSSRPESSSSTSASRSRTDSPLRGPSSKQGPRSGGKARGDRGRGQGHEGSGGKGGPPQQMPPQQMQQPPPQQMQQEGRRSDRLHDFMFAEPHDVEHDSGSSARGRDGGRGGRGGRGRQGGRGRRGGRGPADQDGEDDERSRDSSSGRERGGGQDHGRGGGRGRGGNRGRGRGGNRGGANVTAGAAQHRGEDDGGRRGGGGRSVSAPGHGASASGAASQQQQQQQQQWHRGDVCRAQSALDGRLYIATVQEVLPDNRIRVLFKHDPRPQDCASGQLRRLAQPSRGSQQLYVPKGKRDSKS